MKKGEKCQLELKVDLLGAPAGYRTLRIDVWVIGQFHFCIVLYCVEKVLLMGHAIHDRNHTVCDIMI